MKKSLIILIAISVSVSLKAQYLVSSTLIESKTGSDLSSLFSFIGIPNGTCCGVDTYSIQYNTKNAANANTIASGIIMIPTNTGCNSFPLLSFNHGTVLHKDEVPSKIYNLNIEYYYFATKGYVVTSPDYIGLGINSGFHPFCHSITEAKCTIDLMRAGREFMATTSNTLDGKVFITGYSQGGHAAMATLKHIQDNNFTSEFNVVAGAPMSGPYSLSLEQSRNVGYNYAYNGFYVYIINSYQNVYGNLYGSINAYYDSPYDVNIPPYLTGASTGTALNSILPFNAFNFMQDSMLLSFMPDTITYTHPIRYDLKLNDNYSWKPDMPVRLIYCSADDIVRASNSKMAYDTMMAKGALFVSKVDVSPASNHTNCEVPALSNARNWFNTFRTDCIGTLLKEFDRTNVKINYPNPSNGIISITSEMEINSIEVIDLFGKVVYKSMNEKSISINTIKIQNGLYFIKVNNIYLNNKLLIMN